MVENDLSVTPACQQNAWIYRTDVEDFSLTNLKGDVASCPYSAHLSGFKLETVLARQEIDDDSFVLAQEAWWSADYFSYYDNYYSNNYTYGNYYDYSSYQDTHFHYYNYDYLYPDDYGFYDMWAYYDYDDDFYGLDYDYYDYGYDDFYGYNYENEGPTTIYNSSFYYFDTECCTQIQTGW